MGSGRGGGVGSAFGAPVVPLVNTRVAKSSPRMLTGSRERLPALARISLNDRTGQSRPCALFPLGSPQSTTTNFSCLRICSGRNAHLTNPRAGRSVYKDDCMLFDVLLGKLRKDGRRPSTVLREERSAFRHCPHLVSRHDLGLQTHELQK
jgi:hypothetical protein